MHMKEIVLYVCFRVWLILLNSAISCSNHFPKHGIIWFFFYFFLCLFSTKYFSHNFKSISCNCIWVVCMYFVGELSFLCLLQEIFLVLFLFLFACWIVKLTQFFFSCDMSLVIYFLFLLVCLLSGNTAESVPI